MPRPGLSVAAALVALGLGSSLLAMLWWWLVQRELALLVGDMAQQLRALALAFAFSFMASLGSLALGLALLRRYIRGARHSSPELNMLALALGDGASSRLGALMAAVYGFLYAYFTGLIVIRPGIDFAATYGYAGPTWLATPCCGPFGSVPTFIIALPALDTGFVLVPLNLLLFALLAYLVSINATSLAYALRASRGVKRGWLASLGAALGLAAGCPSCASLMATWFLGSLGGTLAGLVIGQLWAPLILASLLPLILSPYLAARALLKSGACRLG